MMVLKEGHGCGVGRLQGAARNRLSGMGGGRQDQGHPTVLWLEEKEHRGHVCGRRAVYDVRKGDDGSKRRAQKRAGSVTSHH